MPSIVIKTNIEELTCMGDLSFFMSLIHLGLRACLSHTIALLEESYDFGLEIANLWKICFSMKDPHPNNKSPLKDSLLGYFEEHLMAHILEGYF